MANRTDPAVKSIHETNPQNAVEKKPQNLVEKILRLKIHENAYWKERCFGLTAERLVETRPWRPTTSAASTAATASPPPQCASSNYEERGPQVPVFLAFSVSFSSFLLQKRQKDPIFIRFLAGMFEFWGLSTYASGSRSPIFISISSRSTTTPASFGGRYLMESFALTHVDEVIDELLAKDYAATLLFHVFRKEGLLKLLGY